MTADQPSARKYFSQSGEDYILGEVFGDRLGYYVEVGAFDGIHLSNSYSFELAGWSGTCVEAYPRFAELCERQRPASHVINAACVASQSPPTVTFLTEDLGILSGIRADLTEGMERRYGHRDMAFTGFEAIEVAAISLSDALEAAGAPRQIEFISIDVEGTELDVLRGLDLSRYDPSVLLVEGNTDEADAELIDYLGPLGFLHARKVGQNNFFSRDADLAQQISDTKIRCTIEAALHPDGLAATHPHLRLPRDIYEP